MVSIDRRKEVAVYEEDGDLRCIPVDVDASGDPILDSRTDAELKRLFEEEKRARPAAIPDSGFARPIPVTRITERSRR
jgi:hypothetical protein